MEQLISQITQRTGISEQQARDAIDTVATYLKAQLPAPIAAQVDGVLGGQSAQGLMGQAQAGLGGIGDMLGRK